jgi:hypothetical protein
MSMLWLLAIQIGVVVNMLQPVKGQGIQRCYMDVYSNSQYVAVPNSQHISVQLQGPPIWEQNVKIQGCRWWWQGQIQGGGPGVRTPSF